MQVFVVFNASKPDQLAVAIEARFPSDSLALGKGVWLVAMDKPTTRDLGDAIGVSDGENGNAIIAPMDSYWGRAPSHVWEWIGLKKSAVPGE